MRHSNAGNTYVALGESQKRSNVHPGVHARQDGEFPAGRQGKAALFGLGKGLGVCAALISCVASAPGFQCSHLALAASISGMTDMFRLLAVECAARNEWPELTKRVRVGSCGLFGNPITRFMRCGCRPLGTR